MRRGLIVLSVVTAVGGWLAASAPSLAQVPDDTQSWGELLGNGAEVGAFEDAGQPGETGGGSSSPRTVECHVYRLSPDEIEVSYAELQAAYQVQPSPITITRQCTELPITVIPQRDEDTYDWTPPDGDPYDPAWLAELARDRINLPHPAARMAPAPAIGTTAQLPTYFWVTNWPDAPLYAEASAGTVTARVTATAVRQTWRVSDELRGKTDTENCGQTAGVAFDPANPDQAGSCSWTPHHSSAGQPNDDPTTGEPCFAASVTVYWSLSWDSNVTEPEDLGTIPMTSSACIVVHEIQAVVSSSP